MGIVKSLILASACRMSIGHWASYLIQSCQPICLLVNEYECNWVLDLKHCESLVGLEKGYINFAHLPITIILNYAGVWPMKDMHLYVILYQISPQAFLCLSLSPLRDPLR